MKYEKESCFITCCNYDSISSFWLWNDKKESEAMITDISNADMLKTADEKSLINADEAVKAFSDALDKVKKEKISLSIQQLQLI